MSLVQKLKSKKLTVTLIVILFILASATASYSLFANKNTSQPIIERKENKVATSTAKKKSTTITPPVTTTPPAQNTPPKKVTSSPPPNPSWHTVATLKSPDDIISLTIKGIPRITWTASPSDPICLTDNFGPDKKGPDCAFNINVNRPSGTIQVYSIPNGFLPFVTSGVINDETEKGTYYLILDNPRNISSWAITVQDYY